MVNADAASRLTGIASFINNYFARLRWIITKSIRASFVTKLLEMTGLAKQEDATAELKPSIIKRDNEDLNKIITKI